MILKAFGLIAIITFLTQIGVSFYYSSEIINQNSSFNQNQTELENIQSRNQNLIKELSSLVSIESLQQKITPLNYTPINQVIKIEP